MAKLPQQMKEIQGSQARHQVACCELCQGDHPTGYCPQLEEVSYVNNQIKDIKGNLHPTTTHIKGTTKAINNQDSTTKIFSNKVHIKIQILKSNNRKAEVQS